MKEILRKLLLNLAVFLIDKLVEKVDKDVKASSTLRAKQVVFLQNVAKLIVYANSLPGYELTGGELLRTAEQQAIYFRTGKSKVKFSKHQDRLAIDLIVFVNGEWKTDAATYKPLAEFWKSLHKDNVSGYDWKWDYNHFQMN